MLICYCDFYSSCVSNPPKYLFYLIILFRPCTCPECLIKVDWWSTWHVPGARAGSLRWWPGFKPDFGSFAACHLLSLPCLSCPSFSAVSEKNIKRKTLLKVKKKYKNKSWLMALTWIRISPSQRPASCPQVGDLSGIWMWCLKGGRSKRHPSYTISIKIISKRAVCTDN